MSDSVATFTSSKASALKSGVTHTLGLTIGLRLLVACIVIVVWEALVVSIFPRHSGSASPA